MSMRMKLHGVTAIAYDDTGEQAHVLLDGISFVLEPGEWVFVTGPNGSGKSTFVRLLAGHPGRLALSGSFDRGFAGTEPVPYVLQHPDDSFVGMTPWEDVLSGLEQFGVDPPEARSRAAQALDRSGLADLMHAPLEALSGGQKHLAAVAGCTAVGPALLIMDEADAMLDPESREAVYETVRGLWRQGAAVIWVSQRLEQLEPIDRVVAFHNGRIVYDGGVEKFYNGSGRTNDGLGAPDSRSDSICELLGYEPPYPVAVALELRKLGIVLHPLPLTPDAFAKAVSEYAR